MAKKNWKTLKLKLGTYKDKSALSKALQEAGCRVSRLADNILDKVELASEKTEVDLIIRSVAELGFRSETRYDAICARAKELGLELCPAEVGPQLRLQYLNQPGGEVLVIAMEPIASSDGWLRLFDIHCHRGALWLCTSYGYSDGLWYSSPFVFVCPASS